MSQRHDTPGPDPEGEGAAPADLLQMWIAGRDKAGKVTEPATIGEPTETDVPSETAGTADPVENQEADLEAPADEAPADAAPADAAPADAAPDPGTPGQQPAARGWWPSSSDVPDPNVPAASATAAGTASGPAATSAAEPTVGTTDEGGADQAAAWWPYTEPETSSTEHADSDDPRQLESRPDDGPDPVPAALAEPGPDGLHEEVETEWSAADAPAAPAAPVAPAADSRAPAAPGAPPGPDDERGTGGWASFGAAQTAEDVLDRLGSRSAWPRTGSSRPPADLGPRATSAAPEDTGADTDLPDEVGSEAGPEVRAAEPTVPEAAAGTPTDTPVTDTPVTDTSVTEASSPSPAASGPDLSATTHWSLDDFESYIKAQGSNEFASWLGTKNAPASPLEDRPETTPPEATPPEATPPEAAAPRTDAPADEEPAAPASEVGAPSLVTSEPEPVEPSEPSSFAWTPTVVPEPLEEPATETDAGPEAEQDPDVPVASDETEESAPTAVQSPPDEPKGGPLARFRALRDEPAEESSAQEPGPETEEAPPVVPGPDEGWAEHDVEWDDEHDTATDLPVQPAADGQEALFDPGSTASGSTDAGSPDTDSPGQTWDDPDATQHFDVLNIESLEAEQPAAGAAPDSAPDLEQAPTDGTLATPVVQEPPPSYSPGEPTPAASDDSIAVADAPAGAVEPLEPLFATLTGDPAPEPAPADDEPAPEPVSATAVGDDEDHQEWFDDHGLRWVSGDGGYTWFSDDGQGWNAEIGEPIDVPSDNLPAPRAAAAPTHASSAVEQPEAPAFAPSHAGPAPAHAAPLFRDEVRDRAEEDVQDAPPDGPGSHAETGTRDHAADEAFADEVWPSTPGGDIPAWSDSAPATEAMWPGEAPEALPATEAIPTSAAHAAPLTDAPADADLASPEVAGPEALPAAHAVRQAGAHAAPEPEGTATPPVVDGEKIPPFVEYKPRGAYRPCSACCSSPQRSWPWWRSSGRCRRAARPPSASPRESRFFALAFWWGLLSWTPTIVSLSGSVLEVARGSDGERFDLRSPKLMIDVDDDPGSRNWRTTITRPNGTELVIPASAVDPTEFSAIVKHYRAEVDRGAGRQVRGR